MGALRGALGAAILLIGELFLAGCEGNPLGKSIPATDDASPAEKAEPIPLDARLQQSFADAVREAPPADWQRPPDRTLAGKSVGKLYTDVVAIWDSIRFQTAAGKPIAYRALVETDPGPIEIALQPELAPNHVRNFIALARVGYFDGLVFERTVHERAPASEENQDVEVELIEAGCPLGTGEAGIGSLGYWLRPEFTSAHHEEGTVGACHGREPDTAACKFYVTLNRAPSLDGNFTVFGKVTQGIDVARRIFSFPVSNDPEYPEGDRPERPVVIRKVTIVETPGE
jgi:cyclophilin family peptidyl-prolyl cis-trans isomerase